MDFPPAPAPLARAGRPCHNTLLQVGVTIRCKGFTLLELLLATAMMSVVAVSLYSTLRVAFHARDRALSAVGPARSAEVAVDLVRGDLQSALPPTGVIAGAFIGDYGIEVSETSVVEFFAVTGPPPGLLNEGTGLRNTAVADPRDRRDPTAASGVCRVRLLVRDAPDGSGQVLVRQTVRNLLAATEPLAEEEVLCRGVSAFTVTYFDGTQWYDTWDSTTQDNLLPMAVEVTLQTTGVSESTAVLSGAGSAGAPPVAYATSRLFFLPCYSAAQTQGAAQ